MASQGFSPTAFFSFAVNFLTVASALSGAPARAATQPEQISELGLWLVAADLAKTHLDGQPVMTWPDKSGKGYDAVFEGRIPLVLRQVGIHRPPTFKTDALSGHPAVSFDAAERQTLLLNMAGHALGQRISGFSAAFVVRPSLVYGPAPAAGGRGDPHHMLFITHLSDQSTRCSVVVSERTGKVKVISRLQPGQAADSSFKDGPALALNGEAWNRLMVTFDYKARTVRIFLNGTLLARALRPGRGEEFEDVPSPITAIGSNSQNDWLTCQIAELICYEKALEIDELHALDAYLCGKYRLPK